MVFRRRGVSWDSKNSLTDPHVHSDLHALVFDPSDVSGRTLYVGTDGGITVTRDFGTTYSNEYNLRLNTLQLEYVDSVDFGHEFYGVFSAARGVPGLIGGGVQDNGIAYTIIGSEAEEWRQIVGGDGNLMLFVETGHALYYNGDNVTTFTARKWNGSELVDEISVPVRRRGPEDTGPQGLPQGIAAAVTFPQFRQRDTGQLMYAVACSDQRKDLYGLFASDDGTDLHWDFLDCSLPINPDKDHKVLAIDSLTGTSIFVGTSDGRIFSTNVAGSLHEFQVPLRSQSQGKIWRICIESTDRAYALYNAKDSGTLLQLNGDRWDALGTAAGVAKGFGLPTDEGQFYGFDVDRLSNPSTLFVSTDTRVWVSRDLGNIWRIAGKGLPTRPHCEELRVVAHDNGQRFLYLSTCGRSAWKVRLA